MSLAFYYRQRLVSLQTASFKPCIEKIWAKKCLKSLIDSYDFIEIVEF